MRALWILLVSSPTLLGSARAAAEPSQGVEPQPSFRLVWLFGDDDVLQAAESSRPPSPSSAAGDRSGYDPLIRDLRGRFSGRENLVLLDARAEAPAFVPGLHTHATLALGVDLHAATEGAERSAFIDRGSHLELEQRWSSSRLSLRLYPLDGDVERAGESEALAFGGAVGERRDSPYREAIAPPRALRLTFHTSGLEVFVSSKTATFLEPAPNGTALAVTNYGVIAGVTSDVGDHVRLGVGGGHFEHGRLRVTDVDGPGATTSGVALRVAFGVGVREPPSAFAFGPEPVAPRDAVGFMPPGFALGAEWVALGMRRARFERPSETRLSPARGGALLGATRMGVFEARFAALYRDPELVMRNAGGVFPGLTLPLAAVTKPELSFLLAPRVLLHPAVAAGVGLSAQLPAAVMSFAWDRAGNPSGASLVVRRPGDLELLPPGYEAVPVFEIRPALDLHLSTVLSLSAWLSYRRDGNRTRFANDFGGSSARGFANPDFFGYGVALSGGR